MADRILADPSRRRLFEKENLYNLLELPKILRSTETNDSDEQQGDELDQKVSAKKQPRSKPLKAKVSKITRKRIRKDKKYCEYEA